MSKNWSASRLGTYRSCLLKYYYSYVNPYDPSISVNDSLQGKGLCFHETAEQMDSNKTKEEMEAILQSKIEEYHVDTELYPEDEALRRLLLFWPEFITPREQAGYTVKKEEWTSGDIDGAHYVGALDLHLLGPIARKTEEQKKAEEALSAEEKLSLPAPKQHIIIYDYKTAKTASASSYKDQLTLYAYLLGKERNWTPEMTAENVDLYVFFPFSTQKKDNDFDNMLSSVKPIKYTADDIRKVIKANISTVREANSINWDTVDISNLGSSNFTCRFCPFLGAIEDPETGFKGCKCSYDEGYRQVRGLKFHLRENKK